MKQLKSIQKNQRIILLIKIKVLAAKLLHNFFGTNFFNFLPYDLIIRPRITGD